VLRVVKRVLLALGIIFFILLLCVPAPEGLGVRGIRALAVFVLCLSLWVTGYLPLAITSILGMALVPMLGVLSPEEAFSLFGNKAVFFILGALMMAAALYKTGLGSRIAFTVLVQFDNRPEKIIAGIMATSALLSCIMPEHAVAALLFPIVFEIVRSMGLKPLQSNLGKALFLAMAWGAVIGGVTTYLGGARNLLAVGILEKNYGLSIGFFQWIVYALPIPLVILWVAYFLILYFFRPEVVSAQAAHVKLERDIEEMGPLKAEEKKLMAVLVVVICCWLFLSQYIHISVTAILGGVLIFVLKIIDWKDIEDYVNWGVILMYGGAIVVATALTSSGATSWVAERIFTCVPLSPVMFILVVSLLTKIITEGISNVAAVAIVIPLAFSVGSVVHINPIVTTLVVAISGGLAFCLPMGTPPNAIAFSSGFLRISDVVRIGVVLNIVSVVVILLVARFYWPLMKLDLILK